MDRGYSIPIVDISRQTERQVVVDRESGQYLGHPTTVLLDDGRTIFAVYPKSHAFGQLVLKKSTDSGLTWSERLEVPESFSTSTEVPTIYKMKDKEGKSRLFIFTGGFPGRMSYSEDEGDTWTEFAPMGDYGGIVYLSTIAEVGPGEYIAHFHDEGIFIHGGHKSLFEIYKTGSGAEARTKLLRRDSPDGGITWGERQGYWIKPQEKEGDNWQKIYEYRGGKRFVDGRFELYQIRTKDGGLTWSNPELIATHKDALLCEPFIVRSPDGSELVSLMRENARKYNSFFIKSSDNGKTWSQPMELPAALTGDRHYGGYMKDGRLFLSFRDMAHDTPTRGDWVGWVGTYEDIINKREGQYRVRIMENKKGTDCAYPGVEFLEDGTVVTTTYGYWEEGEAPYIMSVRFKPEELDALAE